MSQDLEPIEGEFTMSFPDALEAIGKPDAAKEAMKSVAQYILRERGKHLIKKGVKFPASFQTHLMSTTMLYGMRP